MGGDALNKYKLPDWKQYKVEGVKELEWVKSELAKKGLKDPWLRNEVWRYQGWKGFGREALVSFFRGFKYAAPAVIVTIIVKDFITSKDKGHDDGHH